MSEMLAKQLPSLTKGGGRTDWYALYVVGINHKYS